MTDAEFKLWCRISNKQLGVKFRRQCPIEKYIVDFVCLEKRLVIEIDGGLHAASKENKARDGWLTSQRFKVLRFWNNAVLDNIEGVVKRIEESMSPPPLSSPVKGEEESGKE